MAEPIPPPSTSRLTALLASFRRVTSSGDFIPEIDGLRFVAILSVYVYHLAGDVLRHSPESYKTSLPESWFFLLTQNLNIGVQLFFVISGFILALPFASHALAGSPPVKLGKYFLRRLTRLEPPYLISLLLFFVLKIIGGRGTFGELLPHLAASGAYLHNIIYGEPSRISIVTWSLEVEVQFYLLAPFMALLFRIPAAALRRTVLASLCVLFTALAWYLRESGAAHSSLLGNAQFFLAGFLWADLFVAGGRKRAADARWDLLSLAGWPLAGYMLLHSGLWTVLLLPWLILALYQAAMQGVWFNRLFKNLWLTTLGGMCYSLYLMHNYTVAFIGGYTESIGASLPFVPRLVLQFVLITPGVVLVGAIFFRLIEKPCMRPDWVQRLLGWKGEAARL